ncbi:MAG: 4Fe-4S binding protein [Candidatus Alcyoniella australis]|nr:4Fe-4S binding protein [Candidatus Alcyoniella australis]
MRSRPWDDPLDKRWKHQKGKVREVVLERYAPCEPAVMEQIYNFLLLEEKFPLELVHRVIDRMASISAATTVMTYEEIVQFVQDLPDDYIIACGPCACRLHTAEMLGPDARDLPGGKLDYCRQTPLNVDIQVAVSGEKFAKLETYEVISKQQLLDLEKQCFEMGLVSNIYQMLDGESGICHCSSATCVPLMANKALGGGSTVIRRGRFVPQLDLERCAGHGACVTVCHFDARSIVTRGGREVSQLNAAQCRGCGLCAAVCPEDAISMRERGSKSER